MNAVVLLSGGLDSATVLAIAKREGRACHALSFVYGQRHEIELAAARRVVGAVGVVEHIVFPIDLRLFEYQVRTERTGPMTPSRSFAIASIIAGQLRRWLPIWTWRLYLRAASTSSSPSRGLWLHGFST